jgi:Transposase DDE domain
MDLKCSKVNALTCRLPSAPLYKSSTGWFFGFKLHIVINHLGELLDIKLTAGNVDDRKALSQHDWQLVWQAVC